MVVSLGGDLKYALENVVILAAKSYCVYNVAVLLF